MCTMTAIRTPSDILRIAFNRDEQRTRARELPPAFRQCGDRTGLMPLDPAGGGSWIGANDAGLIAALLNANPVGQGPLVRSASRGSIVPAILGLTTISAVESFFATLDATQMGRFRLVVFRQFDRLEAASDGSNVVVNHVVDPKLPALWTSSSLGDDFVRPVRARLFADLLDASSARQDTFHAHHWHDDPARSVVMSRPDARTVSRVTLCRNGDSISMRYERLDDAGQSVEHTTNELKVSFSSGAWS